MVSVLLVLSWTFWINGLTKVRYIINFNFLALTGCPDNFPPRKIGPWATTSEMIASRIIALRTIAPEDNCPRIIAPLTIPSEENFPLKNRPLDDCSRTVSPKIIAPWQYPTGNGHRGKLSFGRFVVYIVTPRKTASQERCPKDKLHTIYFSPRIRNLSTLIDSCFLLFLILCGLN